MSQLQITTALGNISLVLRHDAAPMTCGYIVKCVEAGLYQETTFYRSDFVIQMGLYGKKRSNPFGNLPVNETSQHVPISNQKGTVSIAHHDVPDNGNTEFFVNLSDNLHLDTAYGGYCVFAQVADDDTASWKTIQAIADAIAKQGQKTVRVESVKVVSP